MLDLLADLISPEIPADGRSGASDEGREEYIVVPGRARPRYLIPAAVPQSARAVVARPGVGRTGVVRAVQTIALQAAIPLVGRFARADLGGWRLRLPGGTSDAPSLSQEIARHLGLSRVHVAVGLGPPRPNRKPVLQVFDDAGDTVGFAKLGVDELTSHLVRHEANFLASHRFDAIAAPELIGLTEWKGLPLALYQPLPLRSSRRREQLSASAHEIVSIAQCADVDDVDVLGSSWWRRICRELPTSGDGTLAERALTQVAARLEGARWRLGTWHGDFTPWNAQRVGATLQVWDWERVGGPVPLGFDPVHCLFQVATLRNGLAATPAAEQTALANPGLLHQLGIPSDQHRILIDCYQLELCLRLLDSERSGDMGDLTGSVEAMLLAVTNRR